MNQTSKNMQSDSCQSRLGNHLQGRLGDLRRLWAAYCSGDGDAGELGTLCEYGLCFDYVPPGTFTDQREGYFRYQLSWGGPSDEFRFFVSLNLSCHRVEYWFLDWFDGAHVVLTGAAEECLLTLWQWFLETGAAGHAAQAAE